MRKDACRRSAALLLESRPRLADFPVRDGMLVPLISAGMTRIPRDRAASSSRLPTWSASSRRRIPERSARRSLLGPMRASRTTQAGNGRVDGRGEVHRGFDGVDVHEDPLLARLVDQLVVQASRFTTGAIASIDEEQAAEATLRASHPPVRTPS